MINPDWYAISCSINMGIAAEYGIAENILLSGIAFWVLKNKSSEKNFHDGLYWTYNSAKSFQDLYPCFSSDKIKRTLNKLIEQDLIFRENFNKRKSDKTGWYTPTEKGWSVITTGKRPVQNAPTLVQNAPTLVQNAPTLPVDSSIIPRLKNEYLEINTLSCKEKEEIERVERKEKESKGAVPACGGSAANARFVVPTRDEVQAYAKSINYELDAQRFLDHYEMTGWMTGKTKIKSWQACVRTWKHRDTEKNKKEPENWL